MVEAYRVRENQGDQTDYGDIDALYSTMSNEDRKKRPDAAHDVYDAPRQYQWNIIVRPGKGILLQSCYDLVNRGVPLHFQKLRRIGDILSKAALLDYFAQLDVVIRSKPYGLMSTCLPVGLSSHQIECAYADMKAALGIPGLPWPGEE